MTKDEALDLALEALEHMLEDAKQERLTVEYWNECVDAITAINQARSAPVQSAERGEPVAWYRDEDGIRIYYESKVWDDATPLYTTPPAAQPAPVQPVALTDDEIWKFWWNKPEVPEGEDDSMEAQFVSACREAIKAAAQRQCGDDK